MRGNKDIGKIYWDACIFIAWLKDEKRPNQEMNGVNYWATEINNGRVTLVTSNLTRVEVLECTLPQDAKEKFDHFLKRSNVYDPAATNKIMALAHEIRDYYQVKKQQGAESLPTVETPDAIHLATAIYYDCDEFHTFDETDNPKKQRRALIPLSGNVAAKYRLVICKPEPPGPMLF